MATFYGTDANDTATANYDILYGGNGNDTLGSSIAGQNFWDGGRGDDYLYAVWSSSAFGNFYGGEGSDFIQPGDSSFTQYIYGGNGDDFVQFNPTSTVMSSLYMEGGFGRDALYGGPGNDVIYGGDGNESGPNITVAFGITAAPGLYGGDGSDYLDGGRGDDFLYGGPGNDRMYGGDDNDTLIGQTGADIMFGGDGNDIYDVDNTSDYVGEAQGAGNDTVYTSVTFALTANVENLVLKGTVRDGGGNELNNNITGNASNNVITGAAGYDVLTGGGGNDVFVFLPGAGVDFITDFVGGAGASDTIYTPATLFSSFADIIGHASQVGADTVIGDGLGDTLVLRNVTIGSLVPDDFVLY